MRFKKNPVRVRPSSFVKYKYKNGIWYLLSTSKAICSFVLFPPKLLHFRNAKVPFVCDLYVNRSFFPACITLFVLGSSFMDFVWYYKISVGRRIHSAPTYSHPPFCPFSAHTPQSPFLYQAPFVQAHYIQHVPKIMTAWRNAHDAHYKNLKWWNSDTVIQRTNIQLATLSQRLISKCSRLQEMKGKVFQKKYLNLKEMK
jgi:hypothetical protein